MDDPQSTSLFRLQALLGLQQEILNCLVNDLHLHFIHTSTVHCDSRESSLDLTKIGRCELNINCS